MESVYREEIAKLGSFPDKGKKVVVIGAGVMGLCCAIFSRLAGYEVEVYAELYSPETTSDKAGAFWRPFLVVEDKRLVEWSRENYNLMVKMVERIEKEGGPKVVDWISGYDYSKGKMEIPPWNHIVKDFRRVPKEELPNDFADGFYYKSVLADIPIYMTELTKFAEKLKIKFHKRKITDLKAFVEEVADDKLFSVINCCGLGAKELLNDEHVHPIAGQIVKIETKPYYHKKMFFFNNDKGNLGYVIMRSDCIVLGGSADVDSWNTVPDEKLTKEIIRRCLEISPSSQVPRNPKIISTYVGLRPGRDSVRLEKEVLQVNSNGNQKKVNVIHNYCHSGSGWTLLLGCVLNVMRLLGSKDSKL